MNRRRIILWISGTIAVLIVIQFIPVKRPGVEGNNPADLLETVDVPDNTARLLQESCYDCHSNQTEYPWYSEVAPVSWLIMRDVRLGRESLNFSSWNSIDKPEKAAMLSDIIEEVSTHEMPMKIYPLMHREAKLDQSDRQLIIDWANTYGESLFAQ